jgi:hypothetical protein
MSSGNFNIGDEISIPTQENGGYMHAAVVGKNNEEYTLNFYGFHGKPSWEESLNIYVIDSSAKKMEKRGGKRKTNRKKKNKRKKNNRKSRRSR